MKTHGVQELMRVVTGPSRVSSGPPVPPQAMAGSLSFGSKRPSRRGLSPGAGLQEMFPEPGRDAWGNRQKVTICTRTSRCFPSHFFPGWIMPVSFQSAGRPGERDARQLPTDPQNLPLSLDTQARRVLRHSHLRGGPCPCLPHIPGGTERRHCLVPRESCDQALPVTQGPGLGSPPLGNSGCPWHSECDFHGGRVGGGGGHGVMQNHRGSVRDCVRCNRPT